MCGQQRKERPDKTGSQSASDVVDTEVSVVFTNYCPVVSDDDALPFLTCWAKDDTMEDADADDDEAVVGREVNKEDKEVGFLVAVVVVTAADVGSLAVAKAAPPLEDEEEDDEACSCCCLFILYVCIGRGIVRVNHTECCLVWPYIYI